MTINSSYCVCELKNHVKAESTGLRNTICYPGGGTYKGNWLKSKHSGYGEKVDTNNAIYNGYWANGGRHGFGIVRTLTSHGCYNRTYSGQWGNGLRNGEGKQFYNDGVYYGWWKNNRRHGLGIKWFKDGSLYLGEWKTDVYHGLGVLFYANGNRYEGHFARGLKNGEGTFYHMHTGQIQKGMWDDDICKTSIVQDEFRNQVDRSTPYPIPTVHVARPEQFIHDLFQKYMPNAHKREKSFNELTRRNFMRKIRKFIQFQPMYTSTSNIPPVDVTYPCTQKFIAVHI